MGLCGKLSIDVAVYLGQILKNLGKRVLIADLTESRGLYYLFSLSEKFPITYGKVDYMNHTFHMYAKENEKYDIILICMEGNIRQISGNRLSKIYYISDTQYSNVVSMIKEIRNARVVTGIIMRDITEGTISLSYLLKCVFCDEYLLKLYEQKRFYEIHDDLTDREYRLQMQYGNFGEFKHLSPEFIQVLKELVKDITGAEKKEINLSIKYAKEGKNIEKYNVLEQYAGKKRNKQ